MSKFAVVATYEIAPEQIDAFLPLLVAHRDRCLEEEPGTLRFDVLQPENNLMLYEVYVDEAAFEAHRNGASMVRFRAEAADVKRELKFIKCALLD
ncbi:MAG: antibiotic biosynthesis monooxygenase [Betaproteobacteria bacterium]